MQGFMLASSWALRARKAAPAPAWQQFTRWYARRDRDTVVDPALPLVRPPASRQCHAARPRPGLPTTPHPTPPTTTHPPNLRAR
jgi:hypothetical protein